MTTKVKLNGVKIRYNRRAGKLGTHTWVYDEAMIRLQGISNVNITENAINLENGGSYCNVEPTDIEKILNLFDDLIEDYD